MLKDLVLKNRSYRKFDAAFEIKDTLLFDLIDLARICPSAGNLQSLRFMPVWEKPHLDIVFENLSWAAYLSYWDGPEPQQRPSAYILIIGPTQTNKFHLTDAGIAAQTILLGATEKGLGGCILGSVKRQEIKERLSIPEELEISLVLALGKPTEKVVIEDVTDPDDIEYWRDPDEVHHVPKRSLNDLIILPMEAK
ncbi:MAG TPA: nitroreductase family protein [Candidatus Cloacimonetes bacterium]|jgi:nitroreductase|nr:nitroreductase family protein [Candidatus Cloacimonadota bacterium]